MKMVSSNGKENCQDCRICCNPIIGRPISMKAKEQHVEFTYAQLYAQLAEIEPSPHSGPQVLCWGCAKELTNTYKFLKKIDDKLGKVAVRVSTKENLEDADDYADDAFPDDGDAYGDQSDEDESFDKKIIPKVEQRDSYLDNANFEMIVIKAEPDDEYGMPVYEETSYGNESNQSAPGYNDDYYDNEVNDDVANNDDDFEDPNDDVDDEDYKAEKEKPKSNKKRPRESEGSRKSSSSRKSYRATPQKPPLHQCPLCIYNTLIRENYHQHVEKVHNNKELKCDGCEKMFLYIYDLETHRKNFHDLTTKYVVKEVVEGIQVDTERIREAREKKRLAAKWPTKRERRLPIQCPLCSYIGIGKANFRNHYRRVHNKQQLKCDGCDESFHLFYRLNRHREEVHNFSHEYVVDESLKIKEYVKGKYAPQRMKTEDEGEFPPKKKRQPKKNEHWPCKFCPEISNCSRNLAVHMRVVHNWVKPQIGWKKITVCPHCAISVRSHHMEAHIRRNHPEYRDPYICAHCDHKVHTKNRLLLHLQQQHLIGLDHPGGHFAFKCSFCEKMFPFKARLVKHEIREHTHDYPEHCNVCGKGFVNKPQLINHLDRHAGIRRGEFYRCQMCDQKMKKRHEYLEHMKHVHGQFDDENPEDVSKFVAINMMKREVDY